MILLDTTICIHIIGDRALQCGGGGAGDLRAESAAHALILQATLATNTLEEFNRVPGLQLVNWVPSLKTGSSGHGAARKGNETTRFL